MNRVGKRVSGVFKLPLHFSYDSHENWHQNNDPTCVRSIIIWIHEMSQLMRLWYLSHKQPAKAQASLRICAVSPEPSLFAHIKNGSRRRARPKIRHLALQDVCTCMFEESILKFWIKKLEVLYYLDRRTTKVLIKLCGCAGWSAPLLFAYGIDMFSHDVTHINFKNIVSWHNFNKKHCCHRLEASCNRSLNLIGCIKRSDQNLYLNDCKISDSVDPVQTAPERAVRLIRDYNVDHSFCMLYAKSPDNIFGPLL